MFKKENPPSTQRELSLVDTVLRDQKQHKHAYLGKDASVPVKNVPALAKNCRVGDSRFAITLSHCTSLHLFECKLPRQRQKEEGSGGKMSETSEYVLFYTYVNYPLLNMAFQKHSCSQFCTNKFK